MIRPYVHYFGSEKYNRAAEAFLESASEKDLDGLEEGKEIEIIVEYREYSWSHPLPDEIIMPFSADGVSNWDDYYAYRKTMFKLEGSNASDH